MKKGLLIFTAVAMLTGLAGCGKENREKADNIYSAGELSEDSDSSGYSEDGQSGEGGGIQNDASYEGLVLLCRDYDASCGNEAGYYYLTCDTTVDGAAVYRLMYMDYASQQEVYLCNRPGCDHNSEGCNAFFRYDEIGDSSEIFLYDGYLWLLSKDYDQDGVISMNYLGDDGSVLDVSGTAKLYRMNPDGTDRTAVYSFAENITVEDAVIGGEGALYFIVKQLSGERGENGEEFVTSSEKKLISVDTDTWEETEICKPDSELSFVGAWGNILVFQRTIFEDELSFDTMLDDDAYTDAWAKSSCEFVTLDMDDLTWNTIAALPNGEYESNAGEVYGGFLYVHAGADRKVVRYDLETGASDELAEMKEGSLRGMLDGVLWFTDFSTGKNYFIDTESGEIRCSTLTTLTLGWHIDIVAATEDDYLVINDYIAEDNGDGSYNISRYCHALIRKEDFENGIADYRPIDMISTGSVG